MTIVFTIHNIKINVSFFSKNKKNNTKHLEIIVINFTIFKLKYLKNTFSSINH